VLSDDFGQPLDAFANGLRAKVAEVQAHGVALAAVQGECRSRDVGHPVLHRAWEQSSQIAAAAVVVDTIDNAAARFYRHFDFTPFPDRTDRLFLPMKTIATLFAGSKLS